MIAPSAMMIETAQDQLDDLTYRAAHAWVWPAQVKELMSAVPAAKPDFVNGYVLGMETARVLLAGMPAAVENKVEI